MRPQIKKFYKTDPPKVGILIQNTISKFSKTKNQTQKRLPKDKKNQKHILGGLKSKTFIKQTPKSGNSDSKYNFKIFKTQNQTQKRPPKFPKYQKVGKKTEPPKVGTLIQNTISKFSKTKNQT